MRVSCAASALPVDVQRPQSLGNPRLRRLLHAPRVREILAGLGKFTRELSELVVGAVEPLRRHPDLRPEVVDLGDDRLRLGALVLDRGVGARARDDSENDHEADRREDRQPSQRRCSLS